MTITTTFRKLALTGTALALTVGSMTGAAATAAADEPAARPEARPFGPDCGVFCSTVINESERDLRIARDWCGEGRFSRSYPCDYDKPRTWQSPGEEQKWADTDTFGIIAGCTASVGWRQMNWPPGVWYNTEYEVEGNQNLWVRVHGHETAKIHSYRC